MGYKAGTVLRTAFETYTIRCQRGVGPSGEIFEALDSDGMLRAVKILHAAKTSALGLKRARDEFNFCFRSTHKNIIPVLDCGRTGPKAVFYVMPVYAHSLRDWIERGISADNVLRIFGNILDGVEAAHLNQVWHGDLKPENLLLSDDGRELVVSDFGAAPFLQDDLNASVKATAARPFTAFKYVAPEQRVRGSVVDGKADIYALGLILHEMFTGETVIGLGHPDIADVAPNFAYLDWTVGRMTNPEPTRRPSIQEVKRELIARGNEFLSIQRLNALKTHVIRESEVDDPFIRNPITIQAVDFKDETLFLTLNAAPPSNWVIAFRDSSTQSKNIGRLPERFVFLGRIAQVGVARGYEPQQLLDDAKVYVESANRRYAEMAVASYHENLRLEREKRRIQIAAAERRYSVLTRLKL